MGGRLSAYLALGRVSNLPTVWTNVLAGVVIARAPLEAPVVLHLAFALSLFYVGGMFLNDAFDREIDARERPERPIPSGRVSAREVFAIGFGLLGAGTALVAARAASGEAPFTAVVSAVVLGLLVVLYDAWHKKNPVAPVVMGACRAAIYVTAALGAGGFVGPALVASALSLGAYVVGLTFVARQENRKSYRAGLTLSLLVAPLGAVFHRAAFVPPVLVALAAYAAWVVAALRPLFSSASPNVGRSVVRLIAGISLVDGVFIATAGGEPVLGLAAGAAGLGATLVLQRWVSGT